MAQVTPVLRLPTDAVQVKVTAARTYHRTKEARAIATLQEQIAVTAILPIRFSYAIIWIILPMTV